MDKNSQQLSAIRQQIDTIDNQMLQLIDQRLDLAKSLSSLKPADRDPWSPAREHALSQRLLDQKSDTFPAKTMISMWSALITCSLMTQGPMILLCQNAEMTSWAQMAFPGAPTQTLVDENWVLQTCNTKGAIAVVEFPNSDQSWWADLAKPASQLYVQTTLPKWPANNPKACCLSVDNPLFRQGQVCWTIIDQRAELPAGAVQIAGAKGLVLIETKSPIDSYPPTGDGWQEPKFIGCFFPALVHEGAK
ncbi:MAG: chorismate mutase [Robiginitomaculum sp.]|nr:chorismate mutase [Robiginitomaculum sp.]